MRVSHTIDVAYVAELARLALTPEEKDTFQQQLETIVRYVEKIGELDLDGIEPTMHGQSVVNVFREDVVVPSVGRDCFLANAPERNDAEIRLPKVVEDA
ncbi:MAG TPA: Asp-tRNA(Asn)/Glu-tRNA(Gln) amidotransferase subunit GatC [Kiritimatiellia bacterium]|nr:Asp-tRNA(Asn)/Glu-tRNA(Gln) amidotransferase subunit GatC [Kiritimatiellia bacterium]HQQ92386.1 Asp-tRNA(Asn)/Glu-tRNA(Gln) amidotransferase subunit GatC [Kiritimatiellia bacterium]